MHYAYFVLEDIKTWLECLAIAIHKHVSGVGCRSNKQTGILKLCWANELSPPKVKIQNQSKTMCYILQLSYQQQYLLFKN